MLRLFALRPPTFQYALTLYHAVFPVLRPVPRSDLPCVRLRVNVRLTLPSLNLLVSARKPALQPHASLIGQICLPGTFDLFLAQKVVEP